MKIAHEGLALKAAEILDPLADWGMRCHEASLALVRSGEFGDCRVARGSCEGVGGQHSWLVLGHDCYDPAAVIIDPTLWSYDEAVSGVWVGNMLVGKRHRPFGWGSIWEYGRPTRADECGEEPFELTPREPWSDDARAFLRQVGPLSLSGWVQLAHFPVQGWPAGEILGAFCDTKHPLHPGTLEAYIPIDILGMNTDRKPGLYLA